MEMIKKGHCLNFGNCPKADRKEIIELSFTEDFVCPECQQDLIEITQKSNPLKKLLFPGIAILLIGGLIWGGISYVNFQKNKVETIVDMGEKGISLLDSIKNAGSGVGQQANVDNSTNEAGKTPQEPTPPRGKEETIVDKTPKLPVGDPSKQPVMTQKKLTLEFGYYEGETINGLAQGLGIMYFNQRHIINPKDPEERYADAGEFVSGVFHDGYLVNGKYFGKDKQQKGTLLIGQ